MSQQSADAYLGSGTLVIGRAAWTIGEDTHFNGQLDDIRIYDRALSSNEVSKLYSLEAPPKSISGETFYSGGQSGDLIFWLVSLCERTQTVVEASVGTFTLSNLSAQLSYELQAFMDASSNGIWNAWEPIAVYSNNPIDMRVWDDTDIVHLVLTDPDNDQDGVPGYLELFTYGTSDDDRDSDDDGFDDGFEVGTGYLDPTNSNAEITQYIRNNGDIFDLYPSNVVLHVALGELLIDTDLEDVFLTLQLMQSQDMANWSNILPAVDWQLPLEYSNRFFHILSSP